jgi:hypothetical protein
LDQKLLAPEKLLPGLLVAFSAIQPEEPTEILQLTRKFYRYMETKAR